MSIIKTEFPLYYPNYCEDLSHKELNKYYSKNGVSFDNYNKAIENLKQAGYEKTNNIKVWRKGNQVAYLTRLRDSNVSLDKTYWSQNLKRHVDIYKVDGYHEVGGLITFGGNEPYWKV